MRRPLAALGLLLSLGCHGRSSAPSLAPQARPAAAQLASLDTPPDVIAYDDASEGLRRDEAWEWREQLEVEVERQAVERAGQVRCLAPAPDEIELAKRSLAGFLIFDATEQGLRARLPSAPELAELAYLFAALEHPGSVVGQVEEGGEGSCEPDQAGLEAARSEWLEAAQRADYEGEIPRAIAAREGLLETFGYPGTLRRCGPIGRAWGGSQLDYAMRELAVLLEHEGQLERAERLYREARPGGGSCGTTTHLRVVEQLMGVIRTGERARGCRAVLPERLANIDYAESYHPFDYGPGPLADAGFNLARLYRGALLTANRELGSEALEQAIRSSPLAPSVRSEALERLEREGVESWAERVRAIEGLVSVSGRLAIPELLGGIARLDPSGRARVVAAIGELGERHAPGECDPRSFISSRGPRTFRAIPSLGASCATSLGDHEAAQLAGWLEPSLDDRDPGVREQTALALQKLLSPTSLPRLVELARSDSFRSPDEFYCEDASGEAWWSDDPEDPDCREVYPVRAAAAAAAAWISGGWQGSFEP